MGISKPSLGNGILLDYLRHYEALSYAQLAEENTKLSGLDTKIEQSWFWNI